MSDRPSDWIEPPGPQTRLPAQLPDDPYKVVPQGEPLVPLGTDLPIDLGSVGAQLGRGFLDWRQQNVDALEKGLREAPSTLAELRGTPLDIGNPALMAFASPGSIRGFHGTPHIFPPEEGAPFGRFRDEAIGSGEGAQAYGYGHYVAGNPKVAESYMPLDDYQVSGGGNKWAAFKRIPSADPTKDISPNFYSKEEAQQWVKDQSNLLEVHILPEESDLLDWDKDVREQPNILNKLSNVSGMSPLTRGSGELVYKDLAGAYLPDVISSGIWGKGAYTEAARQASQALHEAGIPGLRYLDAGSRNINVSPLLGPSGVESWQVFDNSSIGRSGEGKLLTEFPSQGEAEAHADSLRTRNYVIFHPSNLRITARNGQRLEPVDHDPFAGEP